MQPDLPVFRLGQQGLVLHFAHANGYPPAAYRPLLEALSGHFRVLAAPLRPLWPGAKPESIRDWSPLADDLIAWMEAQGLEHVVGCGHSLGAMATLMAALRRPELFRALVLIDPVLFPRWFSYLWRWLIRLGLGERLHPLIAAARRRRRVFESAERMYELYRRKPVFARLSDEALRAYVDALAAPRPEGGVELRYSPEWEVQIYRTGMLRDVETWRALPRLKMPVLLLRAAASDTFFPQAANLFLRRVPQTDLQVAPDATHLLPLEKPQWVAERIINFVREIENFEEPLHELD